MVLFLLSIFIIKYKINTNWPIYILRYCLPIFFITFFGQTFLLIISLYECKNGITYYDSNYTCRSQITFYILYPISIIPIIIQIFLSFITSSIYYIPDYIINNKNNILKRSSSLSNISFLLCKIIIILFFIFDKQAENEHFGILIFISLLTGFNAYCNIFIQNYSNNAIKRLNDCLSLTLFWSFFNLLIKKIFQNIGFNGEIYLFILGVFLIVIFSLFYSKMPNDILTINFNDINSSINCLNYIKQYLKMIDEKDLSRDSLLVFNSYIEKIEDNCTDKKCSLKKYLESLSKGISSKFLLFQYAEKLFKIAKSKFPKNIILRIHYIIFLYTKINKRKEGRKELESLQSYSFNDNLNIFICKKYIEKLQVINFNQTEEKLETINLIQNLENKNNLKEFKLLVNKAASLCYDFWSSLYNYHIQGIENFAELNYIGNQLNKLIKRY